MEWVTLVGLFRRAGTVLQVVDAQMRLEVNASAHGQVLQPPTNIPYEIICRQTAIVHMSPDSPFSGCGAPQAFRPYPNESEGINFAGEL